jgi:hypothetical protein
VTRYYCPASGDIEDTRWGGFDVCCDRPDLHELIEGADVEAVARALSRHDGSFVFDGNDHGDAPDQYRELALIAIVTLRKSRVDELRAAADALDADSTIRPTQFAWVYYPGSMAVKAKTMHFAAERLRQRADKIKRREIP